MINGNARKKDARRKGGCIQECIQEQPHQPHRRRNFRGDRDCLASSLVRGNSAGD